MKVLLKYLDQNEGEVGVTAKQILTNTLLTETPMRHIMTMAVREQKITSRRAEGYKFHLIKLTDKGRGWLYDL